MIFSVYKSREIKIGGKKIKLPISVKQYECSNKEEFKKINSRKRKDYLYSAKYYGIDYRKKISEILIKKYDLSDVCLDILATYIIESYKDDYILSSYKMRKFLKYEVPFSDNEEEDWWMHDAIDTQSQRLEDRNIKYREKQTKLYKLSRIPYDKNKSSWATVDVDNVFQFHGVFYQIDKSNKNYKCDAQNSSLMDRVFCAYCENDIEFYDMNIKKINVNKC